MNDETKRFITVLRIAAIAIGFVTVVVLWDFMAWLPWHVDAILAGLSVVAFAYWYEREECQ
jgi:hypothetical protein